MADVYRVTTVWRQGQFSWTETFYSPSVSVTTFRQMLLDYLTVRCAMAFTNMLIVGVRLSIYGARRRTRILTPGPNEWPGGGLSTTIPEGGQYSITTVVRRPDQVRAALQLVLTYSDDRTTQRYLVGIPDLMSGTDPGSYLAGADPVWTAAYGAWKSEITTRQWGLQAIQTGGAAPTATVLSMVGGEGVAPWGVVYDPAVADPGLVVGRRAHLRNFTAPIRGNPTVNGVWVVDSLVTAGVPARTTATFRLSEAVRKADIKLLGNVQRQSYQIYPIQAIEGVRVGIHKRGGSTTGPRGRRSIRRSLVP